MFTYTRPRDGDGVPVTYTHETTLNLVLDYEHDPELRMRLALTMLHVLMRERDAMRAEYVDTDLNLRLTLEREGVCHATNDTGCRAHSWDAPLIQGDDLDSDPWADPATWVGA